MSGLIFMYLFFFFNDPATTEIYTLSLHDALPILIEGARRDVARAAVDDGGRPQVRVTHLVRGPVRRRHGEAVRDRKSTRLNSSHLVISYAVFCLKKKTST